MPFPGDIATITVTGTCLDWSGHPLPGPVIFDPGTVLTDATGHVILSGPVTVPLNGSGSFSVVLPCTDNGTLNPAGWAYSVTITIIPGSAGPVSGALASSPPPAVTVSFTTALPHSLGPSVDLSALAP